MDERNSNYTIEKSRTGLPVPVIDGVYLHSIYNPQKEAQALAEKYSETLKHKNTVLVLGLGFGYHINEVTSLLRQNFDQYQIVVLEPNSKLIEEFVRQQAFDDENIKIINTNNVKVLFNNEDFIQFLMQKPCVIKHEASFSVNRNFFTNFLAYKAETNMSEYQNLLSEVGMEMIDPSSGKSLSEYTNALAKKGRINSRGEFLTLAFSAILQR